MVRPGMIFLWDPPEEPIGTLMAISCTSVGNSVTIHFMIVDHEYSTMYLTESRGHEDENLDGLNLIWQP